MAKLPENAIRKIKREERTTLCARRLCVGNRPFRGLPFWEGQWELLEFQPVPLPAFIGSYLLTLGT